MSRALSAFWLIAAPLMLTAQSAAIPRSHRVWFELGLNNPYTSLASSQASQMTTAGYDYTQPDTTVCDILDPTCVVGAGIYYPVHGGPSRGLDVGVGFDVTKWLTISGGDAYNKLGSATGLHKDAVTGSTYVRAHWDSQAYWLIPSWRPIAHLRLGAGPGYYSVHESDSKTEITRFGLHAEASGELEFGGGPVFVSLTYALDRAGSGSATNPEMKLNANLDYSSLALGFGVRLLK